MGWAPRAWLARFRLEPDGGAAHITERALLIPQHGCFAMWTWKLGFPTLKVSTALSILGRACHPGSLSAEFQQVSLRAAFFHLLVHNDLNCAEVRELKVPDDLNWYDVHVHGGEVQANVNKLTRRISSRKKGLRSGCVKPAKAVIASNVRNAARRHHWKHLLTVCLILCRSSDSISLKHTTWISSCRTASAFLQSELWTSMQMQCILAR